MEPSDPEPRLFTLEEASRVLPQVRVVAERLQAAAEELGQAHARLASLGESATTNGHAHNGGTKRADLPATLARADEIVAVIRLGLKALDEIGCELKDIRTGLIDFRAVREGRVVCLCWRLGEDQIAYWHELDAGFQGRQPL